jgi:hypothetical protein
MIPRSGHDSKNSISEYAERMQDVLLVSSFALWAMLIGFAPAAVVNRR